MKIYTKNLNIYLVYLTFGLIIFWILLSFFKKYASPQSKIKYNSIQRNTIGYWLWITISLILSKLFFNNYFYFIFFLLIIFVIHEILWYSLYTQGPKDESEVTQNWYRWANIYVDTIKDINNLSGTDLTEGMFNNNWSLSNKESLNLKYETYFKYLKLEPGMTLLDIGCGNCSWINFCQKKNIICTGLTITKEQADFCNSKGINDIIVGDINKDILLSIHKKFDAITNIGALEHFCSISQHPKIREMQLLKYYSQVKNLIKKKSKSGRYLNSIMTTNKKYTKFLNLEWYFNLWLISSSFGYGCYQSEDFYDKLYSSNNSKILIKKDYTEDYRWILVRSANTWGYANYNFKNSKNIYYFILDVLTDPSWFQRYLYGYFNSWFWQFGGSKPIPNPDNKDTPIRSYIYVTKIN